MTYHPEQFVRDDKHQIFLMASPPSLPLSFAVHPWFVINKRGELSRWEVVWDPERYAPKERWGHIVRNLLAPFQGLRTLPHSQQRHWSSKVLGILDGEDELAARMSDFIEQTPEAYPYRDEYAFRGPNSNTYIEWILRAFPDSKLQLPWNAFGKHWIA